MGSSLVAPIAQPVGDRVTVGALQMEPVHGDVAANFARARELILTGSAPQATLIVFPEMGLSGYIWESPGDVMPHALQCSDPATQVQWVNLAREVGAWLVIGHPAHEALTGRLTNRCTLVSPGGVVGHYDKTCLFSEDLAWASPGELVPPIWDTPAGKIAPLICADLDYPEPISSAVSRGAQLIVVPTAWVAEPAPSATWLLRSWEHQIPIIAADIMGIDQGRIFSGGSCVLRMDGSIATSIDYDEGLISAEILIPGPQSRPDSTATGPSVRVHELDIARGVAEATSVTVSLWSGKPESAGAPPMQEHGALHLVVLPTVANPAAGWVADRCDFATAQSAIVVQGRRVAPDDSEELFIFAPDSRYFSFTSAPNRPVAVVVTLGGMRVGVMANRDLGAHRISRALSLLGASVVLGQGSDELSPPTGFSGTRAPFSGGLADGDPTFGHPVRFRAGDANVWLGYCSESPEVPSGIFSPDHVRWPRYETLATGGSWATQHCSLEPDDAWGAGALDKPLVSASRTSLYGKNYPAEVTPSTWRKP